MVYHIYKCTDEDVFEVGKVYDTVTEYLENHVNYPKWVHGDYPSLKVPKLPLKTAVFTLSKMRVKSSAHLSSMTTLKGTIQ